VEKQKLNLHNLNSTKTGEVTVKYSEETITRAMNLIFLFLVTMVFLIMAMSPSVSATVPADWTVRSDLLDGVLHHEGLEAPVGLRHGGLFDLDPTDDGAVNAAKYAVSLLFPSEKTSIEIISGTGQVVRGMKYNLNVIVTFTKDGTRSLHNFEVVAIILQGKASPYTLTGYKELYLHEEKSD
jgi:hypothetical protein